MTQGPILLIEANLAFSCKPGRVEVTRKQRPEAEGMEGTPESEKGSLVAQRTGAVVPKGYQWSLEHHSHSQWSGLWP